MQTTRRTEEIPDATMRGCTAKEQRCRPRTTRTGLPAFAPSAASISFNWRGALFTEVRSALRELVLDFIYVGLQQLRADELAYRAGQRHQ